MKDDFPIQITRISEQEALERKKLRKQKYGLYDFQELDQLTYPGYFTAHFEYFATGEGVTRGILMTHAHNADALRRLLKKEWDSYYFPCVETRAGLEPLPNFTGMVPEHAKAIIADCQSGSGPYFIYASTLHANYA